MSKVCQTGCHWPNVFARINEKVEFFFQDGSAETANDFSSSGVLHCFRGISINLAPKGSQALGPLRFFVNGKHCSQGFRPFRFIRNFASQRFSDDHMLRFQFLRDFSESVGPQSSIQIFDVIKGLLNVP